MDPSVAPAAAAGPSLPEPSDRPEPVEEPAAAAEPSSSLPAERHAQSSRGPTIYRSPEQILSKITPPGCFIGLNHQDHRWTSRFVSEHEVLTGTTYSLKTFDRAFAVKRTWESALALVHKHNWAKWNLIKHDQPLPPDRKPQEPGGAGRCFDCLETHHR